MNRWASRNPEAASRGETPSAAALTDHRARAEDRAARLDADEKIHGFSVIGPDGERVDPATIRPTEQSDE